MTYQNIHIGFFSNNVHAKKPLLLKIVAMFGQTPNLSVINQEMFGRASNVLRHQSTACVSQQSTLASAAQIHLGLHWLPGGCREAPTIHTCSPTAGGGATAACGLQRRPTARGGALLPSLVKVCSCAASHPLRQHVESGFASIDKTQRDSANRLV